MPVNDLPHASRKTTKFYAKSIARAWQAAASDAPPGMMVLSPYITSGTAESVLNAGATCAVHTLFEVELFASGASSLKTLKKLAAAGHELFHLPKLHAKIVLDPRSFVSVGSQNLTYAGTKKKEFSIAFTDVETLRTVATLIQPWLAEREHITTEMIEDMEALLPLVTKTFVKAQKMASEVQKAYDARRAERTAAEKIRVEREKLQSTRVARLRDTLSTKSTSLETAYGRITRQESGTFVYTLLSQPDRDLTTWTVDQHRRILEPFNRYLCILEDSGRIGWARVTRTRITYICHDVSRTEMVTLYGVGYTMRFDCNREMDAPHSRNVRIDLHHGGSDAVCEISAWFSLGRLDILDIISGVSSDLSEQEKNVLISKLNAFPEIFCDVALRHMTTPFTYKMKLAGVHANKFFGEYGTKVRLRVIVEDDNPVLVANCI